jgi:sugar phosphate isomerase/epimerase
MSSNLSRRSLLTAAAGLTASLAAPQNPALAMQPVKRSAGPRMKLSLAAYSFRDYMASSRGGKVTPPKNKDRNLDLLTWVDWCATQDLDGVELTSYYFPAQVTHEFLMELKRRCCVNGLDITSGAIANKFTLPAGPKLDEQFVYSEEWMQHYAKLGVGPIRFFAGVPEKGVSDEEAIYKNAIPALKKACEIAGKYGVFVALENHDYLSRVERILPIIEQVDSPWFGINLDTGNFDSDDPYRDIEKIAKYAVTVQVKAEIHPRGKKGHAEPADFSRLIKILRDANYRGYVVLEYEAKEDPYTAVPKHLASLRKLISA